jgi:hypothetical protein
MGLLQMLIRFDTSNAPDQEAACINYCRLCWMRLAFKQRCMAKQPECPDLPAG